MNKSFKVEVRYLRDRDVIYISADIGLCVMIVDNKVQLARFCNDCVHPFCRRTPIDWYQSVVLYRAYFDEFRGDLRSARSGLIDSLERCTSLEEAYIVALDCLSRISVGFSENSN